MEGLLIQGERDYRFVDKKEGDICRVPYQCTDQCEGELALRITSIGDIPLISSDREILWGLHGTNNFPQMNFGLKFKSNGYAFGK